MPRRRGKFFASCSSKSQTPSLQRAYGVPGDRTLSVFSEWYTTVLVDMLHDEKEPSEWKRLHVGAERGVNCEHMQALVTNIFQRHWEWQEDRRVDLQPGRYRYNTAFRGQLGREDGLRCGQAISGIQDSHLDGSPRSPDGGFAGRNARCPCSASFENSETEFRYSRCIRQGGVEALVLWGRVAKYVLWKLKKSGQSKGWGFILRWGARQ